ncbi:MAG: hypothetical protein GY924_02585 [Planctomycetaceae bacterium]|nr:hypothetical protein [Planctomycetaceae bacterium]
MRFLIRLVRSILVMLGSLVVLGLSAPLCAAEDEVPIAAERILFLGDSITHAGDYISLVETQLRLHGHNGTLINLGLPSETCSGLSEPEHPFPRPNVHSRIDAALKKTQPDVVVACYGMNDGIYYPFSEERFAAYQAGIQQIIAKVKDADAKLVLMTPPAFDSLPLRQQGKLLPIGEKQYSWKEIYEDYDAVMAIYAAWILRQKDEVELVIDLHSAVSNYVKAKRRTNPQFSMSPDGVHVNHEGHTVLADAVLKAWGVADQIEADESLKALIDRRQKLMHAAWLSHVGHDRPGMKPGLPMKEAQKIAADIEKQIAARVLRHQDASRAGYDDVYRCFFPASSLPGELELFVDFDLWLPPGVDQIRGVIVHQHGCGPGASNAGLTAVCDLHWRELAKKWDCALLGSSYEGRAGSSCRLWCDPRNGSGERFLHALSKFAEETGHAELNQVPWCLWGHSGGGFWASLMQTMHPERIVAIWLQSGTAFGYWTQGEVKAPELKSNIYHVPVMACPGAKERTHERFHRAWDGLHAMKTAYRLSGAPFGIAPDPNTGHECGDSRYLAIPFFDSCLRLRLSDDNTAPTELRPIDMSRSWFGSESGEVFSSDDYPGEKQVASWLPDELFASRWSTFLRLGNLPDSSAPAAPHSLVARKDGDSTVLTWKADADFESGLGGFRIERNGETIAHLPEEPKTRYGRPIFQVMNYSGTPAQPLALMQFTDLNPLSPKLCEYRVFAINSAGLESLPAVLNWKASSRK